MEDKNAQILAEYKDIATGVVVGCTAGLFSAGAKN